jgi:hypothetical protein
VGSPEEVLEYSLDIVPIFISNRVAPVQQEAFSLYWIVLIKIKERRQDYMPLFRFG